MGIKIKIKIKEISTRRRRKFYYVDGPLYSTVRGNFTGCSTAPLIISHYHFYLVTTSFLFLWKSNVIAHKQDLLLWINILKPMITSCIPVACVPPARWPYLPACSLPGGCLLPGVSAHRGRGVCSGGCLLWGMSAPGGCLLPGWGVYSQGCVSAPGGSALGGGCLLCGVGDIPACTEADTPLWTESHTPVKT